MTLIYQIQLDVFEGPLDLLLNLVERDRLDITKVSLALVCNQYWDYLKLIQDLDLDLESSYLLVLAELLELKSRVLLPEDDPPLTYDELLLDGAGPDDPLVQKLLEYRRIKEAALRLGEKEREALSSFPRMSPGRTPKDAPTDETDFSEVSLVDLLDAVKKLLAVPEKEATVLQMRRVPVSVPQRMQQIWAAVRSSSLSVDFLELLGQFPSRAEVIVTFLAILELARLRRIRLAQAADRETIQLVRHPSASDTDLELSADSDEEAADVPWPAEEDVPSSTPRRRRRTVKEKATDPLVASASTEDDPDEEESSEPL